MLLILQKIQLRLKQTKKELNLLFQIENPANTPLFIRVSANYWRTITDENIPSKHLWIPAGGRIESSIKANIYPASHAENIRMDLRDLGSWHRTYSSSH